MINRIQRVPGPGVDASGNQVIDPTKNVLDLVRAETRRQDDLRERDAFHANAMAQLRADYEDKLRITETLRLDAIRAVDRDAVTRAAEVSAAQASTLAATVATSAEALRGQVEAQRITTAEALANALGPLATRIDSLLAAQANQAGEKTAQGENRTQSNWTTSTTVSVIGVGLSLVAAFVAVVVGVIGLYFASTRNKAQAPPTVGSAVACTAPGLLPHQICTSTAP